MVLTAAVALAATLSTAPAAAPRETYTRKVAIVLYDGVELLDFAGPGEVFKAASPFGARGAEPAFDVFTVAVSAEPLLSQGFVRIVPQHTIASSPRPDVIVIPGGNTGPLLQNAEFMTWVKEHAATAEATLTVCTGAFVLSKAGLLDGLEATTWYDAVDDLKQATPKAHVEGGRRFVDNGRILTTAGVSAGIDGSLHLVARLLGRQVADRTAQYMEYHWTPEPWAAGQYTYLNPSLDDAGRTEQRAEIAVAEKDYATAVSSYETLLATSPAEPRLAFGMAQALFGMGEPGRAASYFDRAAKAESFRRRASYNAACAYARAGDADRALERLAAAVEAGFRDRAYIESDPDLASLRGDRRFAEVLTRL